MGDAADDAMSEEESQFFDISLDDETEEENDK